MKKVISLLVAIAICIATIIPSAAAVKYYYCFILSCGMTVEMTSPRELTSEELLDLTDYYEDLYCNNANALIPELM
ncbi:MAG: hypothetical protein J5886_03095 [Bacteroidales bacterium]|nr:hypothetical protein [Bacteroidales bacterium]